MDLEDLPRVLRHLSMVIGRGIGNACLHAACVIPPAQGIECKRQEEKGPEDEFDWEVPVFWYEESVEQILREFPRFRGGRVAFSPGCDRTDHDDE